ncbi:TPA: hypothetical protein HA251_02345 [Candidatus Woesearchaeota archaeon]|nr:hypothetical protein [Candidatus Woesearchaeota archaeon]
MIERFRPAGHKAQELSEIVLLKETFKPIQRVIDTTIEGEDKTIGYLYHDVEYKKDCVGSIILSKGLLCGVDGSTRYMKTSGWQTYEGNKKENPQEWFIPSGPLTLELCYRSQLNTTPLSREVQATWHKTFNPEEWWSQTSTLLQYTNGVARMYHDWTTNAGIAPVPEDNLLDLTDGNTPCVNQFLRTILGKRSSTAQQVFGQYGSPVRLWTPHNTFTGERALVLGVSDDDRFDIDANGYGINDSRPARGIALAKKLLAGKRYEVRDV